MRKNNKYYVPEITDMAVGYECERFQVGEYSIHETFPTLEMGVQESKNYVPCIIGEGGNGMRIDFSYLIQIYNRKNNSLMGYYRTPYLTKEQMEKELPGWEYKRSVSHWFFSPKLPTFKEDTYLNGHRVTNIRMHMYPQNELYDGVPPVLKVEFRFIGDSEEEWSSMYEGMCPSINEFRKIMKGLGL